ncbi:MAG TPA: hypothetical protein VK509_13040 [Polyangiales bacterium]|nr:hypothetical protein [Polyangiales bacterium]
MTDAAQNPAQEELEAAKAFRPKVRPMGVAIVANIALAALLLGVPYYRGHAQGEHSLDAFARFAGCLLGGEPGKTRGLGLPPGEADHFAAQVMLAGKDWPARCRPLLQAIAPEEAVFLWPSVKVAGADVRALVQLEQRELDALSRQRLAQHGGGRVPARPLLALSRLRAGLTLLARATGTEETLDSDAVRFSRAPGLVPPARLPIMAGSLAALQVWAGQDGLRALAMDGRGVSWLQVEDGKLDRHRVRRTSLVRAALRAEDRPLLVWAMPQERCDEQADRCIRRATGVALLGDEDGALPTPTWLGGHPAGRADRSLRWGLAGRVDLLARKTSNGELELRRYALDPAVSQPKPAASDESAAVQAAPEQAAPPLSPTERYPWPDPELPSDALLLPTLPAAVAYTTTNADGAALEEHAFLWSYEQAVPPVALGSARGKGAWLRACEADGTRWIAFGTSDALSLARVDADGSVLTPLANSELAIGAPLATDDPAHDRVRITCGAEQARLFLASANGLLLALRCERGQCTSPSELVRDVLGFDVVQRGDSSLVAYSRVSHPEIAVLRLDAAGRPQSPPIVPAACWDPTSGMCGQPTLVDDSGRLLLVARDAADLLAIESNDGGARWLPMSGLKVDSAISTDPSAPMKQHRLRKGLE